MTSTDNNDEKLEDGLLGTVKIDDSAYSAKKNDNPFDRLKYAMAGLIYLFVRHRTIRNISIGTVITLSIGAWLQVTRIEWAILLLAVGMLWISEIINTGLEAVVDLTTEGEIHPMAKVAKDVAAAATLVTFVVALVAVVVLLLPDLIEKF
ncbi:MAG: diacylglycerol kinase family protein [Chloroflexota bacterium]